MMMQNLNGLLISMWPALADAAVKSAAVLLLTWIVALLFRHSSAARRHLVWTVGLMAILLLPLFTALMPQWRIHFAQPAPANSAVVIDSSAASSFEMPLKISAPGFATFQPTKPIHTDSREPSQSLISHVAKQWRTLLVVIWLIGAAALLSRTLLGVFSLARLARRSHALTDPAWKDLLADSQEQLRTSAHVTLLTSDQRVMPMTWGILQPRILLPQSAANWPEDQRKIVLLHELAHIRRHDCLFHLMSQLARAAFWFNPLSWVAVRQMMLEREIASDDLVIARGILASDYAEHLINIASCFKLKRLFPTAAIAMARSSKMSVRVGAVLDPDRPRHIAGKKFAVSAFAAALLLLMPLAMLKPFAASAQSASDDANKTANAPTTNLELPPIPVNTQVLLHADLSKVTPDSLDTAAFTIFGKPYRDSGADRENFGHFRQLYEVITLHGASEIWMLDNMIGPGGKSPYAAEFVIGVKDQAQADALGADLRKILGYESHEIFQDGGFLIMRGRFGARDANPAAPPVPAPNDPATAAEFEKAMRLATPGDAVQLALVFDETFVSVSASVPAGTPPAIQKLARLTQTCKSITISARPGDAPDLHLMVRCADAEGAKKATDLVNEILPDLVPALVGSLPKSANDPQLKDLPANLSQSLQDVKASAVDDHTNLGLNSAVLTKLGTAIGPLFAIGKSQAVQVQAVSNERQLAVMILMYVGDHRGKLPDKLEDVATYAGPNGSFKLIVRNPNAPGVEVGYIYEKPVETMSDVKNPSTTPMLWEVNPKDGKKADSGAVGYSDGHIELQAAR